MIRLHLIRHGQASFGAEDYDQLSHLGQSQSLLLGQYLRDTLGNKKFLIISGDMQRHRQTTEALVTGLGGKYKIIFDRDWNEVDYASILEAYKPELGNFEQIRSWIMAQQKPTFVFQRLFEASMARWASGLYNDDYAETRLAFLARVRAAAIKALQSVNENTQILVVTSCMPIVGIVKTVLGISESDCRDLESVMMNASFSTLIYKNDTLKLSCYNNFSYLEGGDGSFVTHR